MKTAAFLLSLAVLLITAVPVRAAVVTGEVPYRDGNTELLGYYAYDDKQDAAKMPGVIVVHEWWGHNDYARHRAEQLAGLGYFAFAVDMYGKGVLADMPDKAGALAKPFNDDPGLMRRRAHAGIAALKSLMQAMTYGANKGESIGAIGYCFGGTVVLELVRGGETLKGAVALHGNLKTPDPAAPGSLMGQSVLALNGADDPMAPPDVRAAFVKEMQAGGANVKSVDYAGAKHAFTNPASTEIGKKFNLPVEYNAEADAKSFEEMKAFLAEKLKK
jgi:dienelactone hydrolase